jgi:hypothetical protein
MRAPRKARKAAKTILPFVATLVLSSTAWAAPSGQDADEAARKGTEGGVTVYDFDDDNVDGEILSPDGANVNSRARVKHASLINIRPHFLPELIALALDV